MKTLINRWMDAENGIEISIFINNSDKLMVRGRDIDSGENFFLVQTTSLDMATEKASNAMVGGSYEIAA